MSAVSVTVSTQVGAPQPGAQATSSVWDGVYTAAQAERGQRLYGKHCGRCHGEDPANARNPLAGDRFAEHWESRTLDDLFRRIRDTMPAGEVGTVNETDKLDTMVYILQQNGFPAGRAELTPDVLAAIRITGKSGPLPVRTGTLVRTTGCLAQHDNRDWQLIRASEPERTALESASTTPGGQPSPQDSTRTIALLNLFPAPTAHGGHRVAVTGFLVKRADGDAVNVVSLEILASLCLP